MTDLTYTHLLQAVCDAADDDARWFAMRVLSDYLLEQGDERWEAWAWLAEWRFSSWFIYFPKACWWDGSKVADVLDANDLLPEEVFARLRGGRLKKQDCIREYPTLADAYTAAVAAYLAARKSGWRPEVEAGGRGG